MRRMHTRGGIELERVENTEATQPTPGVQDKPRNTGQGRAEGAVGPTLRGNEQIVRQLLYAHWLASPGCLVGDQSLALIGTL